MGLLCVSPSFLCFFISFFFLHDDRLRKTLGSPDGKEEWLGLAERGRVGGILRGSLGFSWVGVGGLLETVGRNY